MWLVDHELTLSAFAQRHGFAQQTLHGWIRRGVRIPAEALAIIARATCLPEAFWLDDGLPYPPPLDYMQSRERATSVMAALSSDDLRWVLEVCSDAGKLRKARALWRAAEGDPRA